MPIQYTSTAHLVRRVVAGQEALLKEPVILQQQLKQRTNIQQFTSVLVFRYHSAHFHARATCARTTKNPHPPSPGAQTRLNQPAHPTDTTTAPSFITRTCLIATTGQFCLSPPQSHPTKNIPLLLRAARVCSAAGAQPRSSPAERDGFGHRHAR